MLFFREQRNRSDFPVTFEQGVVNEDSRQQANPCELHTMQQPQSTEWHLKCQCCYKQRKSDIAPKRKANMGSFTGFPEAETVSANIAGIVGEHNSVKAEFWNAN